jgi:hypothetical protein
VTHAPAAAAVHQQQQDATFERYNSGNWQETQHCCIRLARKDSRQRKKMLRSGQL